MDSHTSRSQPTVGSYRLASDGVRCLLPLRVRFVGSCGMVESESISRRARKTVTNDAISDAKAAAVRGDFESAIAVLRPLADAGNRDAQYELGVSRIDGVRGHFRA